MAVNDGKYVGINISSSTVQGYRAGGQAWRGGERLSELEPRDTNRDTDELMPVQPHRSRVNKEQKPLRFVSIQTYTVTVLSEHKVDIRITLEVGSARDSENENLWKKQVKFYTFPEVDNSEQQKPIYKMLRHNRRLPPIGERQGGAMTSNFADRFLLNGGIEV